MRLGLLRSEAVVAAALVLAGCGGSTDKSDRQASADTAPIVGRMREAARPEFVSPPVVSVPSTVAIELDAHPGEIVAADEGVWVVVGSSRVVRIDPATNRVVATVPIQGDPYELAAGYGAVWVTGKRDQGADVLQRIDPDTNRVVATIPLAGSYAGPVAAGEGAVWLVLIDRESRSGSLARVDPETNEVVLTIPLDDGRARYAFDELTFGQGAVWVLALEGLDGPGDVIRVDPETNRVAATIHAEALNTGIGPGGLWITGCVDCDEHRDTFFAQEIDTEANAPVGPRIAIDKVGFGPLFVGKDSVWFSGDGNDGSTIAFKLNPKSRAIEEFLRLGRFFPTGAAFDAKHAAIWVARAAPASVVRVNLDARRR